MVARRDAVCSETLRVEVSRARPRRSTSLEVESVPTVVSFQVFQASAKNRHARSVFASADRVTFSSDYHDTQYKGISAEERGSARNGSVA